MTAGRYVGKMSKSEGDWIAMMVLKLVGEVAKNGRAYNDGAGLEHNTRPEPPEATLGYMPSGRAA